MKLYLSGAITGIDNYKKIFDSYEQILSNQGYDVVNPAKIDLGEGATWEQYMKIDLKMMLDCDIIAMIPGWENSGGAKIEKELAEKLGLLIIEIPQ